MGIQSLRRWHWALIGALAGIGIAIAQMLAVTDRRLGGDGFISQKAFERGLAQVLPSGKASLWDIEIHPQDEIDLVSATQYQSETQTNVRVLFAAPRPYTPLMHELPRVDYSVRDYLAEQAAINPKINFGTAWWDEPRMMFALYTLAGAALLGGVWPTVLRLLVGAGLGRKEEPYDLDRFKSEPAADKKEIDPLADQHLAELEAEMIAGLEGSQQPAVQGVRTDTPIVQLQTGPVEVAPESVGPDKNYQGDFYPVEKKTPHGFTLVELLVCMGIITVLISILLPAIQTAKRQAETVQCASNLRQIGTGLMMYANSNKGWLPAWSGWHTWPAGAASDSTGPAWTIEMIPYIGSPDSPIYNCPSFPSKVTMRNYFLGAMWSGRSGRNAMKLSDVKMTSRFVLSGDKTQRALYPPPFGTSENALDDADPDDYGAQALTPVIAWPWDEGGFYMHRRGNNVLFDDMHVGLFSKDDPQLMTWSATRMQLRTDVTPD